MTGREMRLSRLFNRGENAVIVAVDHGEFDGPLPGMTDLPEVVKSITPEVDGVLLSPGMSAHCGHVFDYKGAPMPIVRLNWGTVYCFQWGYHEGATVAAMRPADAVAAGAEIVLVSLTLQTGSEERDARNVEVFCSLTNEAHRLGLPVIGEVFPVSGETLTKEELHNQVIAGCRIVSELGADLIKTFFTYRFSQVVESCPVPILGLGAKKTPLEIQALRLAESEIRAGARGVVFGRNAIQAKDPSAFISALCDVVKRGVDPSEAAEKAGLR